MRSEPVPLVFQLYFYGAIALALLVSLIAVASYRRAVSRNMLMKAGSLPTLRTPLSDGILPHVPVEPSADYTEAARRLKLRLILIYGAAIFVVSAFAAWIRFFTGNTTLIRGSTVFVIWRGFLDGPGALALSASLFSAIGIPLVAVLLAWHWRRAAAIFMLYVGSWATVAFALIVARHGSGAADSATMMIVGQLYLIGLIAPLPFLLLLVTGNRRIRAVIPMTLAGSLVFCALILGGLFVPGAVLPSLASTLWPVGQLFFFACVIIISLLVCWRALGVLAAFYESKFFSDRQLLADSLSLVVILYVFARLGETPGTPQLLIGLGFIVFCVYRTLVHIGLRCAVPHLVRPPRRRLLLLRTFGFRQRTERLFDIIAEQWRFHGPVLMIAGPDLAVRTINPADYLRFLSRGLRDRFVKTDADLQRGLERLDELPDPDGRYRVNELFCRDDTWQEAFVALLDRADVVLMDLRGFNVDNRGCLFELERLVARGPVGHVFLAVDGTTDRSLLDLSIQDALKRRHEPDRRPGAADLHVIPVQKATARAMNSILIELQEGTPAGVRGFHSQRAAIAAFAVVIAVLLIGLFRHLPGSKLAGAYNSSREIEAAARSHMEALAYFDRAVALQESGDDDGAIAEYRRALAQSPGMGDAHHNIAVILERKGQYDAAIVEYRQAVAAMPQQGQSHYNLGAALGRRGDYDAAIAQYRAAIAVKPDLADAHYNLGVALDRMSDYDAAIAAYRGALAADPGMIDAHYNLGVDLLLRKDDVAGAMAAFQKAVALKPEWADARAYLGTALVRTGNLDEAIAEFRTALATSPDRADLHYNLAFALYHKRDYEAAIAESRTALALEPDSAQAHYCLGLALHATGREKNAAREFEAARRLNPLLELPDLGKIHLELGIAMDKRGDREAAIGEYRKALAVNPRLASAHYNIGRIFDEREDWDAAILEYRKALAIRPDLTEARYNLGTDLDRKGDLEAAIAEFQAVLAVKPDLAEAHNALAMALFVSGDAETAMAEFRRAIAHKSDYAEAHYNLGIVLYKNDDNEAAIKEYRAALAIRPDLAEAHYNLAMALKNTGSEQEAEQEFREAQRLNPALKRQ